MYETMKKVRFAENSMEADAAKIDSDAWDEMRDEVTRHTLDKIVQHVQALEDRVAELEK